MPRRLDNLQAQRVLAGHSQDRLAQLANVSDRLIRTLEAGGECTGDEAQRLADALGVSLVTLGNADLQD